MTMQRLFMCLRTCLYTRLCTCLYTQAVARIVLSERLGFTVQTRVIDDDPTQMWTALAAGI